MILNTLEHNGLFVAVANLHYICTMTFELAVISDMAWKTYEYRIVAEGGVYAFLTLRCALGLAWHHGMADYGF